MEETLLADDIKKGDILETDNGVICMVVGEPIKVDVQWWVPLIFSSSCEPRFFNIKHLRSHTKDLNDSIMDEIEMTHLQNKVKYVLK